MPWTDIVNYDVSGRIINEVGFVGGDAPPPVTREIPVFNGVDQSVSGDDIVMSGAFTLEFTLRVYMYADFRQIAYQSTGASNHYIRLTNNNSSIQFGFFGVTFASIANAAIPDGTARRIVFTRDASNICTITVDGNIEFGPSAVSAGDVSLNMFGGGASFANVSVYDVKLNDGSVVDLPFDDTFANNPTARNRGSGNDWTFSNMDAAAWVEE